MFGNYYSTCFTINNATVTSKILFSLAIALCELDLFFKNNLKGKQSLALLYYSNQEIQLRDSQKFTCID